MPNSAAKRWRTPILILTALSDEHDKVAGLDRGADDYVSKPFSVEELSARIRALLRRRGKLVTDNKLEYAEATLDLMTFTLSTPKGEIGLTAKEFELLRYLFEYPNFVAAKEDLIVKAWGLECDFESNNLEVYMSFIRKKTAPPRRVVHHRSGARSGLQTGARAALNGGSAAALSFHKRGFNDRNDAVNCG